MGGLDIFVRGAYQVSYYFKGHEEPVCAPLNHLIMSYFPVCFRETVILGVQALAVGGSIHHKGLYATP